MQGLLALEDGRIFHGRSFGDPADAGGEVVFSTAMTGYQEVLTDPSYHGQVVVFTSAHIGNYGIHADHGESTRPWAAGLIVRDLCDVPSHPDSIEDLRHFARRHRLCGLADVDTRALTLHLRTRGVLRGWFTTAVVDPEEAVARARALPPIAERPLVSEVTAASVLERGEGGPRGPRVLLLDFGVKESIVGQLEDQGCRVVVVPAGTSAEEIDRLAPDGVVLSNGPGDPEALRPLLPVVRHVIGHYPTLAICLGHQLAGLALGGRTVKLRFGHHGSNHPVRDLATGAVCVTAQNHNYAVDAGTLPPSVEVTHVNLNDGTVEGFVDRASRLWSYQFHPEGAPGPHDSRAVFREFVDALAREGSAGAA
jgi:carbamoyl-phosphate synthase small subunit